MKNRTVKEEFLRDTPLPEETKTYTVIPHAYVIDTIRKKLKENKFVVENESFSADKDGKVGMGSFRITNDKDPEMAMVFNFANSYDKTMRFNCSIGGYVYDISSQFVSHEAESNWKRKHTGTAYDETNDVIDAMIACASEHFDEMIGMKEVFKNTPITQKQIAQVMGVLYFEKAALNSEQASIFKKEMMTPGYEYGPKNNLWYLYKMLMVCIRDTPVLTWTKQQMKISMYVRICKEWLLTDFSTAPDTVVVEKPVVDHSLAMTAEEPTPEEHEEVAEEIAENEIAEALETEEEDKVEEEESVAEVEEEEDQPEDEESEEEPEAPVQEAPKSTGFSFKVRLDEKPAPKKETKKTVKEPVMSPEQIEVVKEEHGQAEQSTQYEETPVNTDFEEEDEPMFVDMEMDEEIPMMDEDEEFEESDSDFEVDASLTETEDDGVNAAEYNAHIEDKPEVVTNLVPDNMQDAVEMILESNYPKGTVLKASAHYTEYSEFITENEEVFIVEK